MGKSSEEALGQLHGAIARVLTNVVEQQEEEVSYDAEGEAVPTGNMMYTVSPAMMATAVKFLKDNSITCDIEQDNNMGNLKEALAKKQKHSRLNDPKGASGQLKVV